MGLLRAYAANSEGAGAYRRELVKRAATFGLDPRIIRGAYEKPVLLRVIEGLEAEAPKDVLVAAVRRTNESLSQGIDAKTLGIAQARVLSAESVEQLGELLAGEVTLRDAMRQHPEVFRKVLERDHILTPQNHAQWLAPSGALTDQAKDQIEAMFVGLVLGTADRLRATPASLTAKVERAVPALVSVRGKVPTFDLIPSMQQAVDLLNDSSARGLILRDYLAQPDLLGGGPARSREAVEIAKLLDASGQRQTAEAFGRWARVAIHDPKQGLLFGAAPTPDTAFEALLTGRVANPRPVEVKRGSPCPRCSGSGRIAPWAGKITWCPSCGGSGLLTLAPAANDPRQQRLINPRKARRRNPDEKPKKRKVTVAVHRSSANTTRKLARELCKRWPFGLDNSGRLALPQRVNVHLENGRTLHLRRHGMRDLEVKEDGQPDAALAMDLKTDLDRRTARR